MEMSSSYGHVEPWSRACLALFWSSLCIHELWRFSGIQSFFQRSFENLADSGFSSPSTKQCYGTMSLRQVPLALRFSLLPLTVNRNALKQLCPGLWSPRKLFTYKIAERVLFRLLSHNGAIFAKKAKRNNFLFGVISIRFPYQRCWFWCSTKRRLLGLPK